MMAEADRDTRNREWLRWLRRPATLVPILILGTILVTSVFASWLAPHDPLTIDLANRLAPPIWAGGSAEHFLGTDRLGRDVLTRIMYSGRWSLATAVAGVAIASVVGVSLGVLAGYLRGKIDWFVSLLISTSMAFPTIVLALAAIAAFGPSFRNLVIVLGFAGWPQYARVIRAESMSLRSRDFIVAAKVIGMKTSRILTRHMLPNLMNSVIVLITLQIAVFILVESFLSYLGLGIQPPTPSWGSMLNDGREVMLTHPWIAAIPGMMILITTLSFNLLGDSISDLLDPGHESE